MTDKLQLLIGQVSDVGVPGREASAILLRGSRIEAIGNGDLVQWCRDNEVPTDDLGDQYLLPGFVDPHAHLEVASRARQLTVDCRVPECRNISDVLDRLSAARDQAAGSWLVGQANLFWDRKLEDGRFPTRAELDSVSTETPIVVRAGGHASILNTRAFEVSDVERYAGGKGLMGGAIVERGPSGELTGMIAELDRALPIPYLEGEELEDALVSGAYELFSKYGVTTVGEISETRDGVQFLADLAAEQSLPVRLETYLWSPGTLSFDEACHWSEHLTIDCDPSRMRVRGIKLFADGGYSAKNAATLTPYLGKDPASSDARGKISLTKEFVSNAVARAADAGLQIAIHANGERAQAFVSNAVLDIGGPIVGFPVRAEHAGNLVTSPATEEAWRRAELIPIPQAVFLYNFGGYLTNYLGDAVAGGLFPFRTLLDHGWRLAPSSDVHLGSEQEQTNPFFSIWCALSRRSFAGQEILPDEAVSLDDALRMHTLDAAISLGVGDDRGSLVPGKRADIAVLAENPYDVAVDRLRSIAVDRTYLDGVVVYERGEAK